VWEYECACVHVVVGGGVFGVLGGQVGVGGGGDSGRLLSVMLPQASLPLPPTPAEGFLK